MGRLIGIEHFLSATAYKDEKTWQASLRRLRREILEDNAVNPNAYTEKQCEIAQDIRKEYGGRLLRRTVASIGYDGQPLVNLPPLVEESFVIDLQPWESQIIKGLTSKVAAE